MVIMHMVTVLASIEYGYWVLYLLASPVGNVAYY